MIAIMTVTGVDNTGIIAAVTTNLAELGVNIVDVSQTLMSGFFTMILRVEFDEQKVSLEQIQERMNTVGEKINQSIRVQSEALFTAMNEI
ncbi:ACT domain-containing protein [Corynebacterium sp.]|uniref:ACT domain-containing protein n=1 Tax=Corynebacterium sp. TaxID=1720 RepID=UPI0026DD0F51|nr:ACT domain-containing protein [Corynebacterium sp.]MDO5031559.1 ACT domain-containing protein [Corynebacterium sp.]